MPNVADFPRRHLRGESRMAYPQGQSRKQSLFRLRTHTYVRPSRQVSLGYQSAPRCSAMISAVEHSFIDEACCRRRNDEVISTYEVDSDNEATAANCVPSQVDEISAHLLSVSPTLVPEVFAARLAENRDKATLVHQLELLTPGMTMFSFQTSKRNLLELRSVHSTFMISLKLMSMVLSPPRLKVWNRPTWPKSGGSTMRQPNARLP
jgi:hypothetical protein